MAGPNFYNLNNINVVEADGGEMGNEITFDVSSNQFWLGDKVITVSEDSKETRLIFHNDVMDQLGYTTDNGDIVIKIFGVVKDYSGSHVDTSKVIGTVRVVNGATDYFDDETRSLFLCADNTANNFWEVDGTSPIWLNYFNIGNESAKEKQILKGSYLSETFYCGKGDDEIYTGPGGGDGNTNSVYLNTGNATVTLGAADDLVYMQDTYLNSEDHPWYDVAQVPVFSNGGSTIKGADENDVLCFADTARNANFYKKGNDLVVLEFIPRDFQYGGTTRKGSAYEARVNIENYFASESKIKIDGFTNRTDEDENAYYQEMINNSKNLIEGKRTLKGTYNSEGIVANAKSTIYTGAGDDEIYLSTGNDSVIVNGNGNKTIFASGATGHNTININNSGANVNVEFIGANPCQGNQGTPVINRSGNDLIIRSSYNYSYASAGYNTSSVTVKNFFKNEYNLELMGRDIEAFLVSGFNATGDEKKKNTLYGSKYNERFTGGKKHDTIYTGAGNDIVYATAGNDTVIVDGAGTKEIDITNGDVTVDRRNPAATVCLYADTVDEPFQFLQKSKNDLIIRAYYFDGSKYTQRKAVIKNAFNSDGTVKAGFNLNENSIAGLYSNYKYVSGKGKITLPTGNDYVITSGSAKNDTINTSTNVNYNIIFAGNGNDKIILGEASNVVHGEGGNDTISVNKGSDNKIYTGAGKDTVNINIGSGNTIYTGAGNDTININSNAIGSLNNLYFNDGDGNDEIDIDASCGLNLNFLSGTEANNNFDLTKAGDDLIITRYHKDAKGILKSDTVTIDDYFEDTSLYGTTINGNTIGYMLNSQKINIKGTYNKKAKATYFYSTEFKDIINGTSKKDVITMDRGYFSSSHSDYEVVAPGKGDDTIYLTAQKNSFYLNLADGDGKDTLIFGDLCISDPSYTQVHLQYLGKGAQGSVRKGDDLVIHNIYEDTKGNIKSDSLIVKEFFDSSKNNRIDYMMENNEYFSREYVAYSSNKKNNITINENILATTGAKDDIVTVNSNATVFTGKGNDKITLYGDSDIYTGKGNDTITLSGDDQSVYLNFNKGDGNDTIIANGNYDDLYFVINDILPDSLDSAPSALSYVQSALDDGKMGFKTNGNDLIFYRQNGKKQDTIIMKDTVKYGSNSFDFNSTDVIFKGKNVTFSYGMDDLIDYWADSERGIEAIGSYNKKTKTTSYEGAYNITSEFNFSGKGKATMKGGKMDDIYNVIFSKKTNLLINDSANYGTDGDLLDISAKTKDISIFFDVHRNGSIGTGETGLLMFQKGCMNAKSVNWQMNAATGRIVISDYFGSSDYFPKYGNTDMLVGGGKIEKIEIGDNNIATEDWISSVAFEVAQWLNQNDCTSAMYTLNNGTKDQINSLLAIYQGHTADMYTNMQM